MEITKSLQKLLLNTQGVQHIFITDKEGVPIIGVNESGEEDLRNRMQLINSNQITMEQVPKLNLGEQKSAIFCYESTTLVILQISSLFAIIIANSAASIGTLRNLRHPLKPIITEIANAVGLY
uniref:Roadblock/LC7 domain-containing protein n=1 Tax=Elaeophora elaphi TaxID=1147741 RepID=A0A0R3RYT5_9BILA